MELRVRDEVNQAIEKELQNLKEAYERDLKSKKSKGAKKGKVHARAHPREFRHLCRGRMH